MKQSYGIRKIGLRLSASSTVGEDVTRAFCRAQIEPRSIVLNMSADFMWQEAAYEMAVVDVFQAPDGGGRC